MSHTRTTRLWGRSRVPALGSRALRVLAIPLLVVALGFTAGFATEVGTASAAPPPGTTLVTGSLEACGSSNVKDIAACATARSGEWLAHMKESGAVKQVVWMNSVAAGVWRSSSTRGICGFSSIGLGLHHCEGTTFINPRTDTELLRNDVTALVALSHESAHGLQEKAGLDPVWVTVVNSPDLFRYEQSADCWAGMAMRWYIARHIVTWRDLGVARDLLRASGGNRADAGHGIGAQRVAAFDAGLRRGATACNTIIGLPVFPG